MKGGDEKLSLLGVGGKKLQSAGTQKEGKKQTPGEIRIQKGNLNFFRGIYGCLLKVTWVDIAELDGGEVANTYFPDPNNLTNFHVVVKPDTGYWKGAEYKFTFHIPDMYPHEAPKVVTIYKHF